MGDARQEMAVRAEAELIGTILLQPATWPEACESIGAEHFYRDVHARLWRVLTERANNGESLELIPVVDALLDAGWALDEVTYTTSLPELPVTTELVPHLVKRMHAAHARRQLATMAGEIRDGLMGSPEELKEQVRKRLARLDESEPTGWADAHALVDASYAGLTGRWEALQTGSTPGWGTPWPAVDRLTGGIRAPQVWILGGRPGMGKTAVLLQMLLQLARMGTRCGLLSLELPADVCVQRWIAQLSHVELSAIRDGRMDKPRWEAVSAALSTIRDLPLWVDDRPATPSQVRARIEVLRRRHGVEVVGLDYLQLVGRDTGARFGNRTEEVGAVAHALQASAKGSGVAILAAAQVNRGVQTRKDKRPVLSDLRESGDIEAVADVVLMPWRADYEGEGCEGQAEILVRKSRHGETGDVVAAWEGRYQEMVEVECTHP